MYIHFCFIYVEYVVFHIISSYFLLQTDVTCVGGGGILQKSNWGKNGKGPNTVYWSENPTCRRYKGSLTSMLVVICDLATMETDPSVLTMV